MKTFVLLTVLISMSVSASDKPYSGQQYRNIKALSEQKVEGYIQGKGMGMAKAAELNHFPGPRHVLDLAEELELSARQIKQSELIFDNMKENASSLGRQLVDKERELDHQFSKGTINDKLLSQLLGDIGQLESRIRYVHLTAHIQQKALLNNIQIASYDRIRGYRSHGSNQQEHKHH